MTTATETCENCGRGIGRLETPRVHEEHVVCSECWQRLRELPAIQNGQMVEASRVEPPPPMVVMIPEQQRPGTYLNPEHTNRIVTIEKTSKSIKLQQALASLALVASIIWMCVVASEPTRPHSSDSEHSGRMGLTALALFGSLAWLVVVRIETWWRHG